MHGGAVPRRYTLVHAAAMYPVLSARTQRLLRAISRHLQPNVHLLPQPKDPKTPSLPEGRLSFADISRLWFFTALGGSIAAVLAITPVLSGCVFFGRLPVFTP